MAIIIMALVTTAVIFGVSIGVGILISKGIDKIIGVRAENWYNKICKSLEE